jgi:O-antigen/teichoic acid export membrane protein
MNLLVFLKNPHVKHIANNTFWSVLDKAIKLIGNILVTSQIARYLGPSDFGKLSYFIAITSFFQILSIAGLEAILVRDAILHPKESETLFCSAFLMRLCLGLCCYFLIFILSYYIYGFKSQSLILILMVSSTLIFQSFDVIDLWFQSLRLNRYGVSAKTVSYIFISGIKFFAIYQNYSLLFFGFLVAMEAAISTILLCSIFFKKVKFHKFKIHVEKIRELLKESWPIILSGISITIYMKIDQILIGKTVGIKELGLYSAVLPILTLIQSVPAIFTPIISPYLLKVKAADNNLYLHYLQKYMFLAIILAFLFSMFLIFFSESIIVLIFGKNFLPVNTAFKIYSVSSIPVLIGAIQSIWIMNEKKHKASLIISIIVGILSIASGYIFISFWGLPGAAVSFLLCAIVANVVLPPIFMPQIKGLYRIFR